MADKSVSKRNDDRSVIIARYMISTENTVRGTAMHFGISKSTVHKDVTKRLKSIDTALYNEVSRVLAKNKAERHLRGGAATKIMYLNKKHGKICNFPSDNTIISVKI